MAFQPPTIKNSPLLVEAFNSLLKDQTFRPETLTAVITMLPKPHTDNTSSSNYLPLSLLNLNIKLLAKTLSTRLNPLNGALIHTDQVGVIPA